MNIQYCRSRNDDELLQILELQQQNLLKRVPIEVREKEGFVTVLHSIGILRRMNDVCPHIIAKDRDRVIGYALCMHAKFAYEIEVLKPMFNQIKSTISNTTAYIAMGQICINKDYRQIGVFRKLYETMKKELLPEYDCIITAVDAKNSRSLKAHYAVGFGDLKTYSSKNREWKLIVLK